MAADQGNADRQIKYGSCLENGRGVPEDGTEAAKYCKMSADQSKRRFGRLEQRVEFAGLLFAEDISEIIVAMEHCQQQLFSFDESLTKAPRSSTTLLSKGEPMPKMERNPSETSMEGKAENRTA